MRVLLAEDESALADAVVTYLSLHHHQVDWRIHMAVSFWT